MSDAVALTAPWRGLIDDAAVLTPGDAALPDAVAAYTARRDEWYADLVASFVGLAIALALVSLVLQKYVLPRPGESSPREKAEGKSQN